MKTILYLTDFYYQAKGREYFREDLYITSKLKEHFNILIGHPHQVNSYLDVADIIIFRNTGSVLNYEHYFNEFVHHTKEKNIFTFNSFDGKGDQQGKDYLISLTTENYPVIPTIDRIEDIDTLGSCEKYMVKNKKGADSIGQEVVTKSELNNVDLNNKIVQPYLDFMYEVSFYYLNNEFQYALYAKDKTKRWELTEYIPSQEDLRFANTFIQWNGLTRGITRIDGCRLKDHSLQLVELEDLNPYLSLDVLTEEKRIDFIDKWIKLLSF